MADYYDDRGKQVPLDSKLGQGAEGTVYSVLGAKRGCVKILDEAHRTPAKRDKLQAMIEARPSELVLRSSAWPVALVYTDPRRQQFAGFVMGLLDMSSNMELHRVWDEHSEQTWAQRVIVAANIAVLVAELHRAGHRVGDLRERNILVNAQAQVSLVDCDSFEIHGPDGRVHHSDLGTPEYLPPELLELTHRNNGTLQGVERYHSDLHALAVIIFQVLLNGRHPFSARGPGITANLTGRVDKIIAGTFPDVDKSGRYLPPKGAVPFTILPPNIQTLFTEAFVLGYEHKERRPDAGRWRDALLALSQEVVQCAADRRHTYSKHLPACPWCTRGDGVRTEKTGKWGVLASVRAKKPSSDSGVGVVLHPRPSSDRSRWWLAAPAGALVLLCGLVAMAIAQPSESEYRPTFVATCVELIEDSKNAQVAALQLDQQASIMREASEAREAEGRRLAEQQWAADEYRRAKRDKEGTTKPPTSDPYAPSRVCRQIVTLIARHELGPLVGEREMKKMISQLSRECTKELTGARKTMDKTAYRRQARCVLNSRSKSDLDVCQLL